MTPPPAPLAAALADRYVLEKEIGRGGMGAVYRATHVHMRKRVALKVLNAELAKTVGADRFKREIRVAGGLDHPNILRVLDSGEVGDQLWFTMPFVAGTSLQDRLEKGGPLEIAEALRITRAVGSALAAAHAKDVVHRDIKPANIMFEAATDVVKVTDFGIARITDSSRTRTGLVLGTPSFMSPEQIAGHRVDGRSDLYSLGVTLFQMLTGSLPFRADSMTELMYKIANEEAPDACTLRPDLPPRLTAVLARALRKTPDGRYQDGEAMAVDLQAALGDRAVDVASGPDPKVPPAASGFQETLLMDERNGSGHDHNTAVQLRRRP